MPLRPKNWARVSDNPQSVGQRTLCKEEQFEILPFFRGRFQPKAFLINRCLFSRTLAALESDGYDSAGDCDVHDGVTARVLKRRTVMETSAHIAGLGKRAHFLQEGRRARPIRAGPRPANHRK
jgi:hypothetical protein